MNTEKGSADRRAVVIRAVGQLMGGSFQEMWRGVDKKRMKVRELETDLSSGVCEGFDRSLGN